MEEAKKYAEFLGTLKIFEKPVDILSSLDNNNVQFFLEELLSYGLTTTEIDLYYDMTIGEEHFIQKHRKQNTLVLVNQLQLIKIKLLRNVFQKNYRSDFIPKYSRFIHGSAVSVQPESIETRLYNLSMQGMERQKHKKYCRALKMKEEEMIAFYMRKLQFEAKMLFVKPFEQSNSTETHQPTDFKHCPPGTPNNVLFLQNVSSTVKLTDLTKLFEEYKYNPSDKINCRLLYKKMRGMAFITFPEISQATMAYHARNGYILKGLPLMIQYGKRSAPKIPQRNWGL